MAALQETKWFGDEVYCFGGSMVVSVGRPVPKVRQVKKRGEGVAIVPIGSAVSV